MTYAPFISCRKLFSPVYLRLCLRIACVLTGICLLLVSQAQGQSRQTRKDTTFKSDWATGGSAGPSFPVGGFNRVSNMGFHSSTLTEWYLTRYIWLRGMVDFSTYGFESTFTENDFILQQKGNRTLVMGLVDIGYRLPLGKWTPALYVGNGLAYYTEPVLRADVANRRVSSLRKTDFYYALHAGLVLEYSFTPGFRPYLELSTTFIPSTRVAGTSFVVLQPMLGVKVPLKGIVNSVFKRKNS